MLYKFSKHKKIEVDVRLDRITVPKCKQLRYLGFIFYMEKYEIITNRIIMGWLKWSSGTIV